ncbi:MAG: ABC transporter ATP-binding protein [Rhodothermales bacterium]
MLLAVEGITVGYDPAAPPVVQQLSFSVREGEIFALLGPSGCGKTTTLRTIAGFEQASEGAIVLDGEQLAGPSRHVPPERRGIGVVFQDYALFPHLTVQQNVQFGLRKTSQAERERLVKQALRMVGLERYAHAKPSQLSGGQQQRVAIARTIAPQPRLMLLDEPFSNLDALLRQHTRRELRSMLKAEGITTILVTHDQEEALSFADRVAVMRNGAIEQVGTPEQIYTEPRTLFVAQFLGRTNLLISEAHGTTASTPLCEVNLNRPAQGNVLLSIRPEHLTLHPLSDQPGPASCIGEVMEREFKGHDITYHVRTSGGDILIHTPSRLVFTPGDQVRVEALEPAVVLDSR